MSNRYVISDDSDSSSSPDNDDSSWISTTSDDSDAEIDFDEPPKKKVKKLNFEVKDIGEKELNYGHTNYNWIIKEFGKIYKECKVGKRVDSPTFTVGCNEESKWRMQMFPKGNSEKNRNYLSVFLQLVSCKEPEIKAQFKFSMLTNKKQTCNEVQCKMCHFVQGKSYGIKRLINTENLKYGSSFLDNDKLTLVCDIHIQLNTTFTNKIKLVNDLKVLLDSGKYSDVILEVEKKKFNTHKYILAARSSVFDAMFKHDMRENKQNVVEIADISYDVMKEVLRFMYCGEVENLETTAKDLLVAADKYALDDLKIICENALYKSLKVDNAVEILNFADHNNAVRLKEEALNFFVSHVKEVVETPSFKLLGEQQSPLLAKVICLLAIPHKNRI